MAQIDIPNSMYWAPLESSRFEESYCGIKFECGWKCQVQIELYCWIYPISMDLLLARASCGAFGSDIIMSSCKCHMTSHWGPTNQGCITGLMNWLQGVRTMWGEEIEAQCLCVSCLSPIKGLFVNCQNRARMSRQSPTVLGGQLTKIVRGKNLPLDPRPPL